MQVGLEEGSQGQWLLILLLFCSALWHFSWPRAIPSFLTAVHFLTGLFCSEKITVGPFVSSWWVCVHRVRVHRPVETAQKLRAEAIIAARSLFYFVLLCTMLRDFFFFPEFNRTILERVSDRSCFQMIRDLPVALHEAGRRADHSAEILQSWKTRHSYK